MVHWLILKMRMVSVFFPSLHCLFFENVSLVSRYEILLKGQIVLQQERMHVWQLSTVGQWCAFTRELQLQKCTKLHTVALIWGHKSFIHSIYLKKKKMSKVCFKLFCSACYIIEHAKLFHVSYPYMFNLYWTQEKLRRCRYSIRFVVLLIFLYVFKSVEHLEGDVGH